MKTEQHLVFKRDPETIAKMRDIYARLREIQREKDRRQREACARLWRAW